MPKSTHPSEKVSDWISTTSSSTPLVASASPESEIRSNFGPSLRWLNLSRWDVMIINHLGGGGR